MQIKSLSIRNFRNIKDAEVTGLKKANLVAGGNAQGKTNLLESIYYLSTLTSERMRTLNDLIYSGESYFSVRCKVENEGVVKTLDAAYAADGRKKETSLRINENPIVKKSDYIGELKVVRFAPEDIDLVKGSPVERRRNLNILISQISRPYLAELSRYNQILAQRNKLLFQISEGRAERKLLVVWNEQLIASGTKIIEARLSIMEKLKVHLKELQLKISGGKETVDMEYKCSFITETGANVTSLAAAFAEKLKQLAEKEIARKASLVGPHRDDVVFLLNGKDAKYFASEGQQRSMIINLKLAEYTLMKERTKEEPVVLIDDIFFDLDEERRTAILSVFNGMAQVFLAGTTDKNFEKYFSDYTLIMVEDGKVTKNG